MRSGQKKEDLNTTPDVKKSEQLQKKVTGAHKEVDLNMFQSRLLRIKVDTTVWEILDPSL